MSHGLDHRSSYPHYGTPPQSNLQRPSNSSLSTPKKPLRKVYRSPGGHFHDGIPATSHYVPLPPLLMQNHPRDRRRSTSDGSSLRKRSANKRHDRKIFYRSRSSDYNGTPGACRSRDDPNSVTSRCPGGRLHDYGYTKAQYNGCASRGCLAAFKPNYPGGPFPVDGDESETRNGRVSQASNLHTGDMQTRSGSPTLSTRRVDTVQLSCRGSSVKHGVGVASCVLPSPVPVFGTSARNVTMNELTPTPARKKKVNDPVSDLISSMKKLRIHSEDDSKPT